MLSDEQKFKLASAWYYDAEDWEIKKAIAVIEDAESAATAPLLARIAELEKLCDETYVKQGADAYNNACDEMERWQKQRKADGKEVGTTGSLCDGIAWLYLHVSKLDQQLAEARKEPVNAVAYLDIGAGGYMDLGTDLSDEALSALPKGRHMLVIAGTYGVDGYTAAIDAAIKEQT